MKNALWVVLALAEMIAAVVFARPSIISAIKIAHTRKEVFEPNSAYFYGMLFGDCLRFAVALLLIGHAVWITRKLIISRNSEKVGLAK